MIRNPCYTEDGTFTDPYDYTPYLASIGLPVTIFNSILLALIVISYVPQLVKMYRTRSVYSISFIFLHVASYSLLFSTSVFYITTLPQIFACPQNPSLCYSNMIPFLQSSAFLLGFVWWYALTIRLLYVLKIKANHVTSSEAESIIGQGNVQRAKCHIFAFFLFLGVMLSIIAAATATVIFYGMCTAWVRGFTLVLSIISLLFNLAQFSPQIYQTCKVKSPGSMSVLLSSIQFVVVLCMFVFAIISRANWMTYLTMTSSTVQLFILTLALIIYTFRDRIKKSKNDNSEDKRLVTQSSDIGDCIDECECNSVSNKVEIQGRIPTSSEVV
ncbi:Hypothetical protein GLP15_2882 [Giardia lamblia P15]|uniref:PQ loop repeat-containing protein n=1 Tax=Giardia intestinalis (strain P15) TaxID=658858 RepID=E1F8Z2_GIAIA|nr:Hypothetical protein GLP15_2882 [Giardia lamblia P15]